MGIGRFLRRTNSIVRIIDTTKNIIEEGSIKNGLKIVYYYCLLRKKN